MSSVDNILELNLVSATPSSLVHQLAPQQVTTPNTRSLNPTKRIKHLLKLNVMFCTTDPTPSPSLLEMLHRHIVDHHTSPVIRSLFPSGQFLYLQHPTIRENTFNLSSALHLSTDSAQLTQHLGLWSCTEQIPYVQFPLPHICLIIPHVTSHYSTCYFQIFHMLVAPCYLSCFIPSVYKL